MRIAAVGDLHCTTGSRGVLRPWLETIHHEADVLLLCGDLTDAGQRAQVEVLAAELRGTRIPMLAVLGNHEYFAGTPEATVELLSEVGVRVLRGDTVEIGGVGFVGTKGFVGGFGAHSMRPSREPGMQAILETTVAEASMLEAGLARLDVRRRVVVLHYAPIVTTIADEPRETHAFFGSSLLEAPLLRHPVSAVFHGHAHRGPLEGATANGTPVYNVAAPLLRRTAPRKAPYRVITLPAVD